MGWEDYFQKAVEAGYNVEIPIPREAVGDLPEFFHRDRMAIHKGAKATYRQDVPRNSLHLREFEDRFTVEVDRYHPKYHPIKHLLLDAGPYLAAGIGAGISIGLSALATAKAVGAVKSKMA